MSSTFGTLFRVTTFGESHGRAIGCVIDGCPARIPLAAEDVQPQLDRRRPGATALNTPRKESDVVAILSGVERGQTLGTPIGLSIPNTDTKPGDYAEMETVPRPSHADFTYAEKYGLRARSGGGRASARETAARVAAGAVAEKMLSVFHPVEIVAWVESVGELAARRPDFATLTRAAVDATPVRCPDPEAAPRMIAAIEAARDAGDSLGGVVACLCRGVPPGWGEPVFDKLTADLAHAMLSIPATRGFEIGEGFGATLLRGSQHNDPFAAKPGGGIRPASNHCGGIQGGISNGETIFFRVAFKPVSTISLPQQTVAFDGTPVTFEAKGRHDPCVLPRAVPVVEAMAALVLADAFLQQQVQRIPRPGGPR
ncbi:MAG TPA: chorismate synthase [Kiritimatiellia bacterium]|nr:chorismate synthase [Kiritimatiellia bacterium]